MDRQFPSEIGQGPACGLGNRLQTRANLIPGLAQRLDRRLQFDRLGELGEVIKIRKINWIGNHDDGLALGCPCSPNGW